MLDEVREKNDREYRFQAAIHGIRMDEKEEPDTDFEALRRQVIAERQGVTEEQLHLGTDFGTDYEMIRE